MLTFWIEYCGTSKTVGFSSVLRHDSKFFVLHFRSLFLDHAVSVRRVAERGMARGAWRCGAERSSGGKRNKSEIQCPMSNVQCPMSNCTGEGLILSTLRSRVLHWPFPSPGVGQGLLYGLMLARWAGGFSIFCDDDDDDDKDKGYGTHTEVGIS
jgi:hypothetical protein